MKTLILLIVFSVVSSTACNKDNKDNKETTSTPPPVTEKPVTPTNVPVIKPEILVGSWVREDEYKMGFDLKTGGKVSSINMATLDYNSWKLDGNKLILNSTSKGISNPVTVDEVYLVRTITPTVIVLSPS